MKIDLNTSSIIAMISAFISLISVSWTIYWSKHTRKEDTKHTKELDKYTKELNDKQQVYIEKVNNKQELLNHLTNFSNLGHTILATSTMCLHIIGFSMKSKDQKKQLFVDLVKYVYELKKDVHILQTHIGYLTSFLADKNIAITSGITYNDLYFLVELLEDIVIQMPKIQPSDIKKALESSNQLRIELNILEKTYLQKLAEYNEDMKLPMKTFVTGTDLFEWYFPEYPLEIKGLDIEKSILEDLIKDLEAQLYK
ncbi:hypothetical protein N4G37_11445 (plasmid) [Enterococcus faecalis]|uniref:hypothetical protein n=1 Tax=Enterococcus faecalis TaxID=1351 RepID=UPI001E3305AB|nr:hypothetical protein [Enterococcus faecalis]MCI1174086.1 hypothetical protein [Enterococcus faecalis]MCT6646688.1 hypothetical protein [Enterococcus faecalis]MDJ9040204.1 hypothetical protein [Enterococcus faecalis]UER81702.1 hypothetical protein LNB41_14930 [Enterococcus faecalis]